MMLIGIDASRTTAARRTGTEAYSLELTRALLDLPAEHRWRLYFNHAPPAGIWPGRAGVELRVIPWPRLWTHLRLSAEMLAAPPDLLFVPAHVLPPIRPRRSVVTIHDLGYRYFPDAHPRAARLYLDLATRWNARAAARIIADSEATRRDLIRFYRTPAEKIRVVYPGLAGGLRPAAPAEQVAVARRLGIERDYILFLGTLQPRKNLVRLIQAYARLLAGWDAPAAPPLLVLAGGRGWLSAPIFNEVERLGLNASVRFPGYVADADLPALLSGARLFAFPSLHEGFGFPVLEAMACVVPVVCSNTSSLPEVAGDAALLVDPLDVDALASALRAGLTNAALRARMIAAGRAQAARFAWPQAARDVLTVLEEA